MTTISPDPDHRIGDTLWAAARTPTAGGIPVFTIWNAVVLHIAEDERLQAAERLADAVCTGWRENLRS